MGQPDGGRYAIAQFTNNAILSFMHIPKAHQMVLLRGVSGGISPSTSSDASITSKPEVGKGRGRGCSQLDVIVLRIVCGLKGK